MKINLLRQQGFLSIIAIALILIISFLGISITYMLVSSAASTNNFQQGERAFFLAEAGLEHATHKLLTTTLSNRIACSGLSISNALAIGNYAVTSIGPFYASASTTLSNAINSSIMTIPVISTIGYQSVGRIMIDRELINYTAVDATNFLGVTRGVDGSIATSHASGARIGQYQCNLSSQGGIPSLSNPVGGKRSLTESLQLPEGWVVGDTLAGPTNWNLAHWNTPTEKQWTQQAPGIASPQILNAVSIVSNVDAWAIGSKAAALHYNGSTWANINTGIAGGDNLLSVSAISSTEAWASAAQGKIYKWTGGASWSNPSSPGNSLNSISVIDTDGDGIANVGWVVGSKKTAFLYNGSSWTSTDTGITVDLNGVSTLSATDAWAAGNNGKIFRWTGGASWTVVTTPSATPTLNGISMIKSGASDIGWAVGTGSTAWFYNGTAWSSSNSGLAASLTITSVVTASPNEAWLADSAGHIYEWNGSTWTLIFTSTKSLNGIDIIHPNTQPWSLWRESFA